MRFSGRDKYTGARSTNSGPHHTEHTLLSDEEGSLTKEFWVDAQGRPTRLRQTNYETDEPLDAGSGSGGEGSGARSATSTPSRPSENFTFSGFSEPNIITAPTLPTPTPRPTPTPTLSAHEAVEFACDFMNTPYDAVATASVPGEEWRWEFRYSGNDSHEVRTGTYSDGTLIGKSEYIILDGTFYGRESTPDNPSVYGPWSIINADAHPRRSLPCLNTADFTRASPNEPYFTATRFLSEEEGSVQDEFWADSTGRPTRARRTFLQPEESGDRARVQLPLSPAHPWSSRSPASASPTSSRHRHPRPRQHPRHIRLARTTTPGVRCSTRGRRSPSSTR